MSGLPADALVTALEDAQRLGFLGARPIRDVIVHARGFVRALDDASPIRTVLDLGAGGGVPGLVIAHDRPDFEVTLLDRRAKRTDFLERVVRRLGWGDRVTVICCDTADFSPPDRFDAVVARGFGPPDVTLTTAAQFVRRGQPIVISEPPGPNRWDEALLDRIGLQRCAGSAPADSTPQVSAVDPASSEGVDGFVAVFVAK